MTRLRSDLAGLAVTLIAPMLISACATTGSPGDSAGSTPHVISKPLARDSSLSLRLPEIENVLYQGVVSHDGAGTGAGGMLYPAPHPAVFLVALVAHGVINESTKSSQKTKMQENADKVLLPYQPILAGYSYKELMHHGLAKIPASGGMKLINHSEKSSTDWLVESTPVFSMTQDQSALIVDNLVLVYASGQREAAPYKKVVRVVSQPRTETDLVGYWSADNGKNLKQVSVDLFAASVDIGLNDAINMAKPNNNAYKTFRYLEGKNEKMERGQLVSEHCDRLVIKTLRDAPMSIPVRRDTPGAAAGCGQPTRN